MDGARARARPNGGGGGLRAFEGRRWRAETCVGKAHLGSRRVADIVLVDGVRVLPRRVLDTVDPMHVEAPISRGDEA